MECLARRASVGKAAVQRITHDRRAQMLQMYPDLMGSPGMQATLDQAYRTAIEHALGKLAKHGSGRAPPRSMHHRHSDSLNRITTDRLVDFSAISHRALHQGQIAAAHASTGELLGQQGHCRLGARHDHQAAGVFIQPVNNASARQHRLAFETVHQTIQQGAVPVSRARMNHQSRAFVDDQKIGTLMDNIKVDRLRPKRRLGLKRLRLDGQRFQSSQTMPASQYPLIPADCTEFNPALKA